MEVEEISVVVIIIPTPIRVKGHNVKFVERMDMWLLTAITGWTLLFSINPSLQQ